MSTDVPRTPLLNDVDAEDRDEEYWVEDSDEAHERRVEASLLNEDRAQPSPARAYSIRALALLCACSLSIGSH